MRIYSSKTGKWSQDLNFCHLLPDYIQELKWMQQSVYLNGAIYRLPIMHYVLRFKITDQDDEENCDDQPPFAQAIHLPEPLRFFSNNQDIEVGISNGQLNLASLHSFREGLKVWVLQEDQGSGSSYEWIPKHHIGNLEVPGLVLNALPIDKNWPITGPLGFHPYEDSALLYVVHDFHFRCICWHHDTNLSVSTIHHAKHDTLRQGIGVRPHSFPLFSCAVPLQ